MGVASLASATRVEVRDADDGRLVASGAAAHPAGAGVAVDPAVWWDGMVDAIADAGVGVEVAGLAVAARRGATVLVDKAGATLAPASVDLDERTGAVAEELVARLGADRLSRATGQVPGADSPLARLVRCLADDPQLVTHLDGVLGLGDLLTARLTGRRVTDRSAASATGWWDPVAGRWRDDLLDRAARPVPSAGWPAVLPAVLRPTEAADWVSASIHGAVGLHGRPLVGAGCTEVAAAALAAAVAPGAAAALLDDDVAAVVAATSTPVADPRGTVLGLADAAGNHLPTVPIAPLGRALDGIARILGTDTAGLAARASAAASVAAGRPPAPVVLPERPGIRTSRPHHRPGTVVGLDGSTAPGELAWAALLGAAAEVLHALGALDEVGGGEPEGGRLVLAGPVARRPGLAAAVATLAGREVVVVRHGGAATGACVQAAATIAQLPPLDVARQWGLDDGETVEPAGDFDTAACLAAHEAARAHLGGS